jgi:hypothetical protein
VQAGGTIPQCDYAVDAAEMQLVQRRQTLVEKQIEMIQKLTALLVSLTVHDDFL